MSGEEVEELRERIMMKLRRLRVRDRGEMIAEGWLLDVHDHMVPPGWVRVAD